MSTTYANLKQMVANRLGKTNEANPVTLRDNAIIDAARQIYQEHTWNWLLTKGANLSVTAGAANLPSDYNPSFGIYAAWSTVSGTANDHPYIRVDVRDVDNYTTADYVYWITYSAGTWVFNSNQTTDTVTFYYYRIPADLSADADICVIPDPACVRDLAVSLYWLAAERDETNADRFYQRYKERLRIMLSNDQTANTQRRPLRSQFDLDNDGPSILATQR